MFHQTNTILTTVFYNPSHKKSFEHTVNSGCRTLYHCNVYSIKALTRYNMSRISTQKQSYIYDKLFTLCLTLLKKTSIVFRLRSKKAFQMQNICNDQKDCTNTSHEYSWGLFCQMFGFTRTTSRCTVNYDEKHQIRRWDENCEFNCKRFHDLICVLRQIYDQNGDNRCLDMILVHINDAFMQITGEPSDLSHQINEKLRRHNNFCFLRKTWDCLPIGWYFEYFTKNNIRINKIDFIM